MKLPALPHSIQEFENIHLPFWLIKDTCWMMEWRIPGLLMIIPTVGIALLLCLRSRNTADLLLHLATFCWIAANSYWMCCEFFEHDTLKYYAALPFVAGMLLAGIFFIKKWRTQPPLYTAKST